MRPTQRPASHFGSMLREIGRHNGCGHPCPRLQAATFAASSPARLRVTTRGVHSMGQQAPGATRVKAQPAFVSQGRSSATPPSSGGSMPAPAAAGSADPPVSRVDAQARTAMQKITNAFTDRPCSGPISSVNSEAASGPARFCQLDASFFTGLTLASAFHDAATRQTPASRLPDHSCEQHHRSPR